MRPFTKLLLAALTAIPAHVAAQDYSDLHSSVKEFKGLSEEVVKKNPLLNTGANALSAGKGGVGSILNGLGLGKPAPVKETPVIRLSKEQQAIVDNEAAKKAKAETAAKSKPPAAKASSTRASTAPPAKTAKVPALAIAPAPVAPPRPETRKITEESAKAITEGMAREQLVASLGPPKTASAIAGLEGGTRETLTYELESGHFLFVKVLGGRVQSISR